MSVRRVAREIYDRFWRGPQGYGRPVEAAVWDREFASGGWTYLSDMSETSRYAIIHNYIAKWKVPVSILDIGCGQAILRSFFSDAEIVSYIGIDLSKEAIRVAMERRFFASSFLVANFDEYKPDTSHNVIIFNESISYANDPGATFQKYWSALPAGGACIVSIYDYDMRSKAAWRRIRRHATPQFTSKLINEKGQAWGIKFFLKT